jgi:hypothetical protein
MEEEKTFLGQLMQEIAGMDETLFEPRQPHGEGDETVGLCLPYMRKLYALAILCGRDRDQIELDHRYSQVSDDPCDVAHAKMNKLKAKCDVLMELFWASVKQELNLWTAGSIGVREGWAVVVTKNDEKEPPIKKFIDFLSGR